MDEAPRLKAHIRVGAILRRAGLSGAYALVARRGDPDAGAVAVKVFLGRIDGAPMARLFVESRNEAGARVWREPLGSPASEAAVDAYLQREAKIDPDLWIVEIDDRDGRAFLDEI